MVLTKEKPRSILDIYHLLWGYYLISKKNESNKLEISPHHKLHGEY